jgi:hypothetical protein
MAIRRHTQHRLALGFALTLLAPAFAGCNGGGGDGVGVDTEGDSESAGDGAGTGTVGDSSMADESGSDGDSGGETDGDEAVVPPPGGLRRLLSHQYVDSVEYILGPAAAAAASTPSDPSVGTFDAMATIESVPSAADVETYETSAAAVADAALADRTTMALFAPCVIAGPQDVSCYAEVARQIGRLAWRRPLTDVQADRLVTIAAEAQAWDDGVFDTGLRYLLMAILQSPRFVYLVEVGVPTGDGEPRQLDGYEVAARTSFFILGRTPDATALGMAEAGTLDTDEGVRALAESLVEESGARANLTRFWGEYLTTRDLPTKGKDQDLFPLFSPALADAMYTETRLLTEDIVFEQDASILGLFDADYTYVNDQLAALYGVAAPAGANFGVVPLPANQGRAGVLTHAGWLAMQSHTNVNSPTRRGLFISEQLLCQDIPPPPPRVNPQPISVDPGETLRDALAQHMEDPSCATCHVVTDPIGFAFEHYDPIGAYRNLDNGLPVDATGDVAGLGAFDGAAQLAGLVAADERLPRCMVEKVYTASLGWVPNDDVEPALDVAGEDFAAADHRMKQLMVQLAVSPLFRLVGEPK